MGPEFESRITRLEEKKKSLEIKKKLLIEKERKKEHKQKSKRFIAIGGFVSKAGIEFLDDTTLLGAFLEIKKHSSSKEKISIWKETGESFLNKEKANNDTPLSISFNNEIGKNEKKAMKSIRFRYNKFRNEFYGYGKEEDILKALNGLDYKIEIIDG